MKRVGYVSDAGGGWVHVFVDRDLDSYPIVGAPVYVGEPSSPESCPACGALVLPERRGQHKRFHRHVQLIDADARSAHAEAR